MTTTSTQRTTTRRDRGFVALLLITAGALMLAGRVVPLADSPIVLILGIEMLIWAVVARSNGLVIAGGLLTGVGAGIVLAAGPLQGADPNLVGAAFLLSVAVGFALVALFSWWLDQPQRWAWIPAIATGVIGAGLLSGPDRAASMVGWAIPVVLTIAGLAVAAHWLRAR